MQYIIDFVFDNLPDATFVIEAKDEWKAMEKANKQLSQEQKDLLLKTFIKEEST